jgi:tetratricopeptide (TPR) repeat protein
LLSIHQSAEQAMNYLDELVIKYPMQHELRKLYADILYDMEKYQKAAKNYIVLTQYDDYQDHALLQLAYLNITNNDLKAAEKYLLKLSYSQEYKELSQYYLGLVSQQMGKNQKALDYFDQVNNGEYLIRSKVRAMSILNEQKKYDIAATTLQSIYKSSEEDPNNIKNQILAEIEILYEQGLYNDAAGILKILEEKQPNDTDIKYSIGILAKKMNNIELFEKNMSLVLKNKPENSNALSALGWHYFNKKDNQKALDLLTKAFEYDESHSSSIGARLGAVLWSSGQRDKANIVWKQMLELDPSNQALRDIINKYQQ